MQRIIALTAAAALAAGAAASAASPELEQRSVRIHYADLDLDQPAGRRTLERRIERAIDRICEGGSLRDFLQVRMTRECRASAMASVQPQLTALYGGARPRTAAIEARAPVAP